MLTFCDDLPSQSTWKVRQVLTHLAILHRTEYRAICQDAGQNERPAVRTDILRALESEQHTELLKWTQTASR